MRPSCKTDFDWNAAAFVLRPEAAAVVADPHLLQPHVWEPAPPPPLYRKCLRGWRLGLLLTGFALTYGVLRAPADYQKLKTWRARSTADRALSRLHDGNPGEALDLLTKSVLLAPRDRSVLLASADIHEALQSPSALYALRQLTASGGATEQDTLRLCELAFRWSQPELADHAALAAWAALPPERLSSGRNILVARWLAWRGNRDAAITRLCTTAENPDATDQDSVTTLGELLLQTPATAAEGLQILCRQMRSGGPASPRAAVSLAGALTRQPGLATRLAPDAVLPLRLHLAEMAAAPGLAVRTVWTLRMGLAALDWEKPARRSRLATALRADLASCPDDLQQESCRWLLQRGLAREAADWASHRHTAGSPSLAWRLVHLNALFALADWPSASRLLAGNATPALPPAIAAFARFRIDQMRGAPAADVEQQLRNVLEEAARADWADALSVARNLDACGRTTAALTVFTALQNHEHAALPAREGIVQCYRKLPGKTAGLQAAIKAVQRLAPRSEAAEIICRVSASGTPDL